MELWGEEVREDLMCRLSWNMLLNVCCNTWILGS